MEIINRERTPEYPRDSWDPLRRVRWLNRKELEELDEGCERRVDERVSRSVEALWASWRLRSSSESESESGVLMEE